MAIRWAKWRVFAAVGLVAIASPRTATVEADHSGPGPIGRPVSATLLAPAVPGRPVRLVVSVLQRDRGPWPIRVYARSTGAVVRPSTAVEPVSRIDATAVLPVLSPAPTTNPAQRRSFHLLAGADPGNPEHYRQVRAELVASSQAAQIYRDVDDPGGSSLADDLLDVLENVIQPRCDRWIGRPRDVDGDGRLTILLSSRVGAICDEGEPVTGCVRPADFQDRMPEPFGNRCDLIVLDSRLEPGPHARTILAHEYSHAVVAGRKGLQADGSSDGSAEDDWLDEALAHVVEARLNLSRSNLDYRVEAFRRSTESYGLVIADYRAAGAIRSAGHRGAAFGFLDSCARRFGDRLIARLVNSPETGAASLERATGQSLDALFVGWARDEVRTAAIADRIEADGPGATWMAHGTTFHQIAIDPGQAVGLRIEAEAPPGVLIALDLVESDNGH